MCAARHRRSTTIALLGLLSQAGIYGPTYEPEQAVVAVEAFERVTPAASLLGEVGRLLDAAATPAEGARRVREGIAMRLSPMPCVGVSETGAAATITFTGCAGPLGIAGLRGTLRLTSEASSNTLRASLVATFAATGGATEVSADVGYLLPSSERRAGGELYLRVASTGLTARTAMGLAFSWPDACAQGVRWPFPARARRPDARSKVVEESRTEALARGASQARRRSETALSVR